MLRVVFNIFDYDGDGKITLHDLMSLLKNDQFSYFFDDYEVINNVLRSENPIYAMDDVLDAQWGKNKGKNNQYYSVFYLFIKFGFM